MIQAVIFDMDGTLIDSEPMWKEAEKQVFSSVGVNVEEELAQQTATMTTTEVTQFWYQQSPWMGKSLKQVENDVVDCVEALIGEKGTEMEGVKDTLDFFHAKQFRIGLATNSPVRLISVVLDRLGISDYFDAISSSEHEEKGKPDPAVYLSTAKKLQVDPTKCIAFEDSLSGVIAAREANIKTVVVPPHHDFHDEKFALSHIKLRRLSDFNEDHLEALHQF